MLLGFRPLGDLVYIRIWHDNSGQGPMASWFLKSVIVHDLQTREKFYFICQKWFAVEKDDGFIDRLLPVSSEKQKTEIMSLIQEEPELTLGDGHLWLSILTSPVQSSFTRLDRLTCCVVLLYLSMLFNILYYNQEQSIKRGFIQLGPYSISTIQVSASSLTTRC